MLEVILQCLFSSTKENNDIRNSINASDIRNTDFTTEFLLIDNIRTRKGYCVVKLRTLEWIK